MEKDITFKEFNLGKDILESLEKKGFKHPSEVQAKVIPEILKQKTDIVAIAQTGTGKTAAFGLPILELIDNKGKLPKAIVLAPTRELALQVCKEIESFSEKKRIRVLSVYGGASISNQVRSLKDGVDIVIGTPGRIVDMINKGALKLNQIKHFVLDEADEMLNMGFIEDIEFILSKMDESKKIYLFSATMPKQIQNLSKKYMKNQTSIEVKKSEDNNIHTKLIEQTFYKVERATKAKALMNIIDMTNFFYGIIFCKTKSEVDQLTKELKKNKYLADCIHGDIAQNRREKVLEKFREMKVNILVATDVAARGIHVNNLTHVVNHSLPQAIETYVHRIGRTGRAGNKGHAITLLSSSEMRRLSTLEKVTGFKLKKEILPSPEELKAKLKDKINKEYELIFETKMHTKYLDEAKELMKKYDPKDLIAALLHTKNIKPSTNDFEDDREPRENNRRRDRRSRDFNKKSSNFKRKDSGSFSNKNRRRRN